MTTEKDEALNNHCIPLLPTYKGLIVENSIGQHIPGAEEHGKLI